METSTTHSNAEADVVDAFDLPSDVPLPSLTPSNASSPGSLARTPVTISRTRRNSVGKTETANPPLNPDYRIDYHDDSLLKKGVQAAHDAYSKELESLLTSNRNNEEELSSLRSQVSRLRTENQFLSDHTSKLHFRISGLGLEAMGREGEERACERARRPAQNKLIKLGRSNPKKQEFHSANQNGTTISHLSPHRSSAAVHGGISPINSSPLSGFQRSTSYLHNYACSIPRADTSLTCSSSPQTVDGQQPASDGPMLILQRAAAKALRPNCQISEPRSPRGISSMTTPISQNNVATATSKTISLYPVTPSPVRAPSIMSKFMTPTSRSLNKLFAKGNLAPARATSASPYSRKSASLSACPPYLDTKSKNTLGSLSATPGFPMSDNFEESCYGPIVSMSERPSSLSGSATRKKYSLPLSRSVPDPSGDTNLRGRSPEANAALTVIGLSQTRDSVQRPSSIQSGLLTSGVSRLDESQPLSSDSNLTVNPPAQLPIETQRQRSVLSKVKRGSLSAPLSLRSVATSRTSVEPRRRSIHCVNANSTSHSQYDSGNRDDGTKCPPVHISRPTATDSFLKSSDQYNENRSNCSVSLRPTEMIRVRSPTQFPAPTRHPSPLSHPYFSFEPASSYRTNPKRFSMSVFPPKRETEGYKPMDPSASDGLLPTQPTLSTSQWIKALKDSIDGLTNDGTRLLQLLTSPQLERLSNIQIDGEELAHDFKKLLGEVNYEIFQRYIRRFDSGSLPLEGADGLKIRVRKLIENSTKTKIGHPDLTSRLFSPSRPQTEAEVASKELYQRFVRFIAAE